MRMTDADAIIEWAREDMQMHIDEYYERKSIEQEKKRFLAIENAVKHAPTIDAKPVVHGEWITKRTPQHDGEYYCSCCEFNAIWTWRRYAQLLTNFCPNCGADMRGENDGTD